MTPLRFNSPVITTDGEGVLIGKDGDGKMLLCSRHILLEKPRKVKYDTGETITVTYRIAFGWYKVEDVSTPVPAPIAIAQL